MPELKHAAKKSAKKAAKKAAGKKSAAKKSANPGRDTLRAYEHLGRVQALAAVSGADSGTAQILSGFAEQALRAGDAKDAAELLRAAEHHLFGSLALAQPADESLSAALLESVRDEYEHQMDKAKDHGSAADAPPAVRAIYQRMLKDAASALKAKRFRAALELARGAEALTHASFAKLLHTGAADQPKQLKAQR
jgi:hypothetical protein